MGDTLCTPAKERGLFARKHLTACHGKYLRNVQSFDRFGPTMQGARWPVSFASVVSWSPAPDLRTSYETIKAKSGCPSLTGRKQPPGGAPLPLAPPKHGGNLRQVQRRVSRRRLPQPYNPKGLDIFAEACRNTLFRLRKNDARRRPAKGQGLFLCPRSAHFA